MNQFAQFSQVSRRALSIRYVSPGICNLVESSGSGSGGSSAAVIDMTPVQRLAGPTNLQLDGTVLSWTGQTYIFAYVVYYSTAADGPFLLLTSNVRDNEFDVAGLGSGTFYFKVTGIEPNDGETYPSETIGPATL